MAIISVCFWFIIVVSIISPFVIFFLDLYINKSIEKASNDYLFEDIEKCRLKDMEILLIPQWAQSLVEMEEEHLFHLERELEAEYMQEEWGDTWEEECRLIIRGR
jgi:hypothetical protein